MAQEYLFEVGQAAKYLTAKLNKTSAGRVKALNLFSTISWSQISPL